MLARLEAEIPVGDGWRYEPKWDGFRAIVFRDVDDFRIDSRNALRLDRYFPEVVAALAASLPPKAVLDGEIIIAGEGGLDFDALQLRLHPADSRVQKLAKEIPASFVAFDVLHDGEADLRERPLEERRARLAEIVSSGPSTLITPQTSDPAEAAGWFERFEGAGLDGVIAKQASGTYVANKRLWVKVKHKRTADVVVGGYRMSKDGKTLGSMLLGLYDDEGALHHVGFAASFTAPKRREHLAALEPLAGGHSFGGYGDWEGEARVPGGGSRWSRGRDEEWISVEAKLVCEVAFDHMQGDRFRHGARFLRWRPDKDPRECTYDQIANPRPFSLEEIRRLS
jgi:ATP-dependent DNA ligase